MTENSASDKPLLVLTLRTHPSHTHYEDKPIPTLIISTSLLIFLREAFAHFCAITGTASVNTPQEFALGSPASPGPGTAQAWQRGHLSPACPVPNQPNTYRPPLMGADWGTRRNGSQPRFAQTGLALLMIGRLEFPLKKL